MTQVWGEEITVGIPFEWTLDGATIIHGRSLYGYFCGCKPFFSKIQSWIGIVWGPLFLGKVKIFPLKRFFSPLLLKIRWIEMWLCKKVLGSLGMWV